MVPRACTLPRAKPPTARSFMPSITMNSPSTLTAPMTAVPSTAPTTQVLPHPRNRTGPQECPLSTTPSSCSIRCRSRSRGFPSGSSFFAHVNDFHLTKHASRTAILSADDVSRLDAVLSGYGKKVCATCNKECTSLRVHKCSTTPRANPQARAPRTPRTREAPTPSRRESRHAYGNTPTSAGSGGARRLADVKLRTRAPQSGKWKSAQRYGSQPYRSCSPGWACSAAGALLMLLRLPVSVRITLPNSRPASVSKGMSIDLANVIFQRDDYIAWLSIS